MFPSEKKSRGTAEEQEEGSFARTAYLYFKLFVDNPNITRYAVGGEKLFEFEYSKS